MGKSIAEVLGRLQVSIDEHESRITSGTVESISPLLIRKDKLLITEDYIVRSSPMDYLGLKVGQEVILLQANRQQTYYILDIPEESFSDKILKDIDDRIKEIEDVIEFPPVWTIGEDGYWYKDGVKTNTKARGDDGDVWDISGDGYWIRNGIKTTIRAVGEEGRGIKLVKEYYARNNNPLVAPSSGWLEEPVSTSNSNRYLWNYEEITFTDDEVTATSKRIISVHGADGVGISSIENYYLAYPLSEGVTVDTFGWSDTIQVPDSVKKYLWNYEAVIHTDGTRSETIPVIIGNFASDGKELYTWIKYADTPESGMSDDPTGKAYMGVAYNKTTDEESLVYSDYRWAKIVGEDGESTYYVQIISENGLLFKNGVIETTLSAVVYQGEQDVTNTLDANQFRWARVSSDPESDALWNSTNASGKKTIVISTEDVYQRATFFCDIMEV